MFGDDEYNNISKNEILYYLNEQSNVSINLMSIHGSDKNWNKAKEQDVSAGLYELSKLGENISIDNNTSLDDLIDDIESQQGISIEQLLVENAEPINYRAPELKYTIDDKYIVLNWDYIDYKQNNYDGEITYQLVCGDGEEQLYTNPVVLDEYTFMSWMPQVVDYTLLIDESTSNKYYGIIVVYDDSKMVINDDVAYIAER